jgi:hypothetical protein
VDRRRAGGRDGIFLIVTLPPLAKDLQFCFRSDTGTYSDTAGITPATADGTAVALWRDQSDNANDVAQPTLANRPLLKTNQINGLPCLRFDGTDDYLSFVNVLALPAWTAYAVVKADDAFVRTILCGNDHSAQWRIDGRQNRLVDANVADIGFGTHLMDFGTWTQVNVSWDLTNGIFRMNSAADGTVTLANSGYVALRYLGSNVTGGAKEVARDVACVLLYSTLHTTGQRQSVESWINGIFGV